MKLQLSDHVCVQTRFMNTMPTRKYTKMPDQQKVICMLSNYEQMGFTQRLPCATAIALAHAVAEAMAANKKQRRKGEFSYAT